MEYAKHQDISSLIFIALLTFISLIDASSLSSKSETDTAQKDIISDTSKYTDDTTENVHKLTIDELDLLKDEAEKRRMDKMMFHGSIGKRETDMVSDEMDKRGRMDSYGFTGMLGKRGGMDRYGFAGVLGKRGHLDRYGFVGALGRRGGMDRYGFVGALGRRSEMGSYGNGEMGDGADEQRDTDKRARMDRYSFFGTLGKRMRYPMGLVGQLGKRSIDITDSETDSSQALARQKREIVVPWYLQRKQRHYPSRWLRGIDRFSFGTRLGKRVPNYRFYPQLGKRDEWPSIKLGMRLFMR